MGDPLYINATQVINTATNIGTSTAVSLQLTQNKDGSGPLAAEISMPGVRNSTDKAVIVYDDSGGDFYPGLKDVIWNMDNNTIISGAVLQQGSFTPDPGFDQSRWVDFIDAIAPVPGTSQIIAAGSVAAPSASNPQHSTYWALITP
jgi:hypothetical protein